MSKKIFSSAVIFSVFCFLLAGCKEEISSGEKRLKLEFLYKLNNSASIVRDYTIGVTNYRNLSLYNSRVSKYPGTMNRINAPSLLNKIVKLPPDKIKKVMSLLNKVIDTSK